MKDFNAKDISVGPLVDALGELRIFQPGEEEEFPTSQTAWPHDLPSYRYILMMDPETGRLNLSLIGSPKPPVEIQINEDCRIHIVLSNHWPWKFVGPAMLLVMKNGQPTPKPEQRYFDLQKISDMECAFYAQRRPGGTATVLDHFNIYVGLEESIAGGRSLRVLMTIDPDIRNPGEQ